MQLKKHERGVIVSAVVTAAALLVGLLAVGGGAATAASSSPSPSVTVAVVDPSGTSSATPTPTPSSPPSGGTAGAHAATPPTAAESITAYGAAGRTTVVNVLAHSACNGSTTAPCAYADLAGNRLTVWGAPAGVTATVLSTGNISLAVDPTFAVPATVSIKYGIIDQYGSDSAAITFVLAHAAVTPSIGVNIYIGRSQTFDLLARTKCDDLKAPCPASALKSITVGTDRTNPLVTATTTSAGSVTVTIDPKEPPFNVAHIPYTITDTYGSSSGLLVVRALDPYNPKSEWVFNNPLGGYFQQHNVYRRAVDMINHAPPGAVVQMITYLLDGQELTDALVAAKRRGVHVRVLQSQGIVLGQVPYLQQQLGTDPRGDSFYYICQYACRAGHSGAAHSKILGITQAGVTSNIVYSGSSNFSWGADFFQFYDAYLSVGNAAAFQTFAHYFSEARLDRQPSDWKGITTQVSSFLTYMFPATVRSLSELPGPMPAPVVAPAAQSGDWAQKMFSQIGCAATGTHGHNGRTVVRVTIRSMYGARGYQIGVQLAQLRKAGCDVRVIVNGADHNAIWEMQQAGVPIRDMTWNWRVDKCQDVNGKVIPDTKCWVSHEYTHLHAIAVSGSFAGSQQDFVWSGSEGLSTESYYNDEQWVRLAGGSFYQQFLATFSYDWDHYTHGVGLRPTGPPPAAPVTYP